MNSSEPDPLDEIVADLRFYFDAKLPIELWWPSEEEEPAPGYISAIGDNYVILARIRQMAWLNGFHAVRFTAIKEVLPMDDADDAFLARAMEAQGEVIPPQLPVQAARLEELLSTLCIHFPMIVVEFGTGADSDDVGGTILRVEGDKAYMRLLSRQGRWIKEEHELDLSLVRHVWFGSNYERVLERIGFFPL